MKTYNKFAIFSFFNSRYEAKLKSAHPEDGNRRFVINYSLADGTISIMEPPQRNSGHMGGKFLSSMKIPKPGTSPNSPEYYTPHDFYIGKSFFALICQII